MAEDAVSDLQPIEFYKFADNNQEWRFTDAHKPEIYDAQSYVPAVITRGITQEALQNEKQSIEIKMPLQTDFVKSYIVRSNASFIECSIFRRTGGVASTDSLIYIGKISSMEIDDEEATFKISNPASELVRPSGGMPLQLTCVNFLYDEKCLVNKASFKLNGTITSATTTTMTSSTFSTKPDGWLDGGVIEINNQVIVIQSHTTDTITLFSPINFDATSKTFNAFAGCDRAMSTCNTKFSNIENYFAAPYTPSKNPMKGDPISI